jgi:hypothetical protein
MLPKIPHKQDQLGRHHADVLIRQGRVTGDDLDLVESAGPLPRGRRQLRVQFDESGVDVCPARMIRQHLEQIPALPRAEADHRHRTGRRPIQCLADLRLHRLQPAGQCGSWFVVPLMPRLPIHAAKTRADRRQPRSICNLTVTEGQELPGSMDSCL